MKKLIALTLCFIIILTMITGCVVIPSGSMATGEETSFEATDEVITKEEITKEEITKEKEPIIEKEPTEDRSAEVIEVDPANVNIFTDFNSFAVETKSNRRYNRVPSPYIIRSVEDLENYYNTFKNEYDFGNSTDQVTGDVYGFEKSCEKYDDKYFEENILILLQYSSPFPDIQIYLVHL